MLRSLRAELPTALPASRVTGAPSGPSTLRRHATSYSRFGQRQLPGSAAGASGAWARFQRLPPRVRIFGFAAGGSGAFYVANLKQIPETGRYRFIISSEAMERQMGEQAEQQVLEQMGRKFLPDSHPQAIRCRRICERLLTAAGAVGDAGGSHGGLSRKRDVNWRVHVVNDNTPNAFVLPSGLIIVHTGILPVAANDDGLATVLGHEISHQILRHSGEQMSSKMLYTGFTWAVSLLIDPSLAQLSNTATGILLELPNSRTMEAEADQNGLMLMAKACYDPSEAPRLWGRMGEATKAMGGSAPAFLSTHPSDSSRAKRLGELLPKALEARNQTCGQASAFRRAMW